MRLLQLQNRLQITKNLSSEKAMNYLSEVLNIKQNKSLESLIQEMENELAYINLSLKNLKFYEEKFLIKKFMYYFTTRNNLIN